MKKQISLKKYNCMMPVSSSVLVTDKNLKENKRHIGYQLMMKIAVDFERGNLNIESNNQFITISPRNAEASFLFGYGEKLFIETDIYPVTSIDLSKQNFDGKKLSLRGRIKTRNYHRSCIGLIEFQQGNCDCSNRWYLSFTLELADFEIKFDLPLLINAFDEANAN